MKIAIVGGGPAGAYLGYCLAKEGISATIFDDSHPREKPCGGGISSFAIRKFPILHEIPVGKAESTQIKIISPKGREAIVEGEMESWAISRKHLDMFLLKKAKEEGAKLVKERVENFEKVKGIWKIKTKKRVFKADLIVGADGANSIVRKKLLGPIPKENMGICFGCFAKDPTSKTTIIKFLEGKHGYGWVFPREDHLSIGVGTELRYGKIVKNEFERFMTSYATNAKPFSTWAAILPLVKNPKFFQLPTCGKDWMVIGDAAGHVDPITGEGITYAMWSAEIASKAIGKNDVLLFDKMWKKAYGYNLIKGSEMRNLFFNSSVLEISIWLASKSKTFGKILYELINSDQDYYTFEKRVLIELPKILWELV